MLELKNENFQEEIQKGLVLVDFYAVWCGPCKMMHPVIEEFAKDHLEVKIIKVNVDEHEELAQQYGIMSIPTLILMKNGEIVEKTVGFTTKEKLESWISKDK